MIIFTKQSLIQKLQDIANQGWISSARAGNHGGIGNTLEDLLGIRENDLPIPDISKWELKAQRIGTTSLTTLLHIEPSPRVVMIVPQILLPKYGWPHKEAGLKYPVTEMSFRQTINGSTASDRGFMVKIDRVQQRVVISFDASKVSPRHEAWLKHVESKAGLGELDPQPYWEFADLEHKAGRKLHNCFYVQAEVKREAGIEYFWYKKVTMLQKFNFAGFLKAIEDAYILIDFDARTGHNHGTKFRLRQNCLPMLYQEVTTVITSIE